MESIKDTDYCILVVEPTIFGVHNLKMVYGLVKLFNKPHGVVINKYLSTGNPAQEFCSQRNIKVLGSIPYDEELARLNSSGIIVARGKYIYREMFSYFERVLEEVDHETAINFSGKGGTGKTTIASAFIRLGQIKAYADCDVDAPNLHLVMAGDIKPSRRDYYGMDKAVIDQGLCNNCDICRQNCRYGAISFKDIHEVNHYEVEGCGVCEFICPQKAVRLEPAVAEN